jgi:predicted RNase H-like HicB family nuclease/predicted RNA binding protein YcfA (HicA-like mRNA interferase family)
VKGTLNQRKAIKLLREDGWTQVRGGKHQVKMTKPGRRPITLPRHKAATTNRVWRVRFSSRRAYNEEDSPMELTTRIHIEEGSYWADVPELPGCFASGDTLDELFEALQEGVALYLADEGRQNGPLHVATATLTDQPLTAA